MVYTTRFILENESPILYVVHDKNGDWQFLGAEEQNETDARIIAMEEAIELDISIKDILWLPEGMEAWRHAAGLDWNISIFER